MVELSQLDYYDKLERKYLDIKLKTTNIKQELGSYEKIMQILFDHMDENLNIQRSVSQNLSNASSNKSAGVGAGTTATQSFTGSAPTSTPSATGQGNVSINKNTNATFVDDERKHNALKESYEKLSSKYERLRVAKIGREDEYKRCLGEKVQIETHLNSIKTQVSALKKLSEFNGPNGDQQATTPLKQYNENVNTKRSSVSSGTQSISENQSSPFSNQNQQQEATAQQSIVTNEQKQQQQATLSSSPSAGSTTSTSTSYDYDVETINFLNECNWNLGDSCDRQLAESLLSCFPSGTFLVRSARKKQLSFALSVVANSKVQHCLIDKLEGGYCFHPPGQAHQVYPSLCNLVLDYRHKSLLIHHKELDTNLIYPVLSQIKKTSRS